MTRRGRTGRDLVRRAELWLRSQPPDARVAEDVAALVHELRVHQIELEMQNQELRRTQAALQASWDRLARSEERYRQLYEAAPVAYVTLDPDGRIRSGNPATVSLLRTEAASFVGRRFSHFVAPERQDEWHRRRRALARGALGAFPLALRAVEGDVVHVECAGTPICDTEGALGLHLALLDVTKRRQAEHEVRESERRVRLMTDALPALVSFVDRDERYRFANAAYETWFGTPVSSIRGRTVREVLGEEAYGAVAHYIAAALAGRATGFEGEIRYQAPVGRRHVRISYAPDLTEAGEVQGFFAVVVDLTALRGAEEALRAAAAEAELAEQRERRRLAEDLHDDVAQTLSLASMRIQALRDAADPEEHEALIDRVAALVSNARERVGSLSFQLSPPVLHDVGFVAAAQWLAEDLEKTYGLKVHVSARDELADLDETMRVALFRALRELLVNVARHAACAEARVGVGRASGAAEIEVADEGVGFHSASLEEGFGLRSLRNRMEHLGGSVEIESAPGEGTRVRVRAPIHRPPPPTRG